MEARYDFGRNWSEFAAKTDETHVENAKTNLLCLVGDVEGCSFFDLGCGSGLHSAAAANLGAKQITAIDYDPDSVATTKAMLERFAPSANWSVWQADALKPDTLPEGPFDIVYSWGVLHHTGNMWQGIQNAAELVKPGGRLCLALYIQTQWCGAWVTEKRIYANNKWLRPFIKGGYTMALFSAMQIKSGNVYSYIKNYKSMRGMSFMTDIDDWLGGYPYESVSSADLEARVCAMGFNLEESFNTKPGSGLFGTGCGEWRFRRVG